MTAGNFTDTTRYLHKDHLGSVDMVTDESGAEVQRFSFDPWGKRRDINWAAYTPQNPFIYQLALLNRGYTL